MRKLTTPFVVLCLLCLGVSADTSTPVSITSFGTALTENFNSLASVGTSTSMPVGWGYVESGTNANTTYTAGTGFSNTGDTYSFGATASAERAFGGLLSGNLVPIVGAQFTNNTGGTITSLAISYTGEQWRLGSAGRTDRLDFQISTNATALNAGTYTDVDALDFNGPISAGSLGPLDGNLPANRRNISSTINGLSIADGASFFIRWTDSNATAADDGLSIDDFSLTASGVAVDQAPAVTVTSPAAGASNVSVDSTIVITFNESVNATAAAFSLSCGGSQAFSQSASPATSFTLTPASNLPFSANCTVGIAADQITDEDGSDPPDQMGANVSFSFGTEAEVVPPPVATNVIINEVDSDNPGIDAAEFVELYDGGAGNTPLDGLTVVFYNGSSDLSYAVFDLDGRTTDANGYFTLGNVAVPGVGLVFGGNFLQNGQDAVALYVGNAADFPINTPVTLAGLQDAVVYDTDDADDAGLLALLNPGEPQVNENGGGDGTGHSIGRCPDGSGGARNSSTYQAATPTPDGSNICPPPPPPPSASVIVISQVYGGGGSAGASHRNDYVELYNRGTVTVDTAGWSLQYAAATGSGWNFNKTPLGGPIAPGEYYLVKLASNGANGAPLPDENVAGLINLSATQGKIAIVDNFDSLVGNCPLSNPHLKDLVGYGAADCGEGATTAPSPSASTAALRLGNGATDTDINASDFATGAPNPRRTAPIVELGPVVLATDPSANGFNAPRDPTIVVTFTEPVAVTDPWFDITCSVTGQHNSHTLAGSGRILDITPNVNLLAGESCTVTLFKDQVRDQDLDDTAPNTDTLSANYVWSFTVASGTAPPYPSSVHLTFGNPTNATADIGHPENYFMDKPEYSLSYNRDLGRANWVSWHLSTEWYGSLTRVDTFRADPAVPPDWYRVQGFDFSGSGFDRGHMVPNADRDKETSIPINQATYLMTNIVAQAPGNNQGPWADLENHLRSLTDAGHELYIVAGPEGIGGSGSQGGVTTTIANGRVTVPANTWKVALVLPKMEGDDVSRVSCATPTIAVVMPNIDTIREENWRIYLTSVDAVEALSGLDLFANLPDAVEYCVEAGIDGNNPPADLDPPVVTCGAADGAWHGGNVTIACTASDGASGLGNPADASFTLVTSVGPGHEDGNAATDTRVVCDAVGNCATAGPIAGNMIDRKAPQITLTTPADGGVYQFNKTVLAAFACVDGGSGAATCAGTVANGAAIDTSSVGAKSFVVTASDAVGNVSSTTVSYAVATGNQKQAATIVITNIPADAGKGGRFTPVVAYSGDGQTHLRSDTPAVCKVHGDTSVRFVGVGTCTVSAWATPSGTYQRADGPQQSFVVQ